MCYIPFWFQIHLWFSSRSTLEYQCYLVWYSLYMSSPTFIPLLCAFYQIMQLVHDFLNAINQFKGTKHIEPIFPLHHFQPKVESNLNKHIQAALKMGNFSILTIYSFFPILMISNDRLELLSKIRTPKLREWGKKMFGSNFVFPILPSSGTLGDLPRHSMMRVHHHSPSRGFNVMTRS